MKKGKAEIIMVVIVAMWGLSFSLTKPILRDIEIFNFMALRFLIGGFILSSILFLSGRLRFTREQLIGGGITGGVLFLGFVFHTIGLKYTTVAKNAFIVGSSVVFVPFMSTYIGKQKQSLIIWVGTCMAILGLALVTLEGHQGGINFGDLMTLIGSVILAYYIILVEEYVKKYDAILIAVTQINVVGLLSLIASFIVEKPTVNLSLEAWKSMLFLGIVCTALAYLLANVCQKHIPATNMALIYTLEPVFAALFGWIFLSESIGIQAVIGAIVIVISAGLPNIDLFIKKMGRRIQIE
ncbi:MAG: DMT family transporter [Maledivibacter sp.]|jgi:drug/metabolite transporter (DMT)-like permease|nr:DMT family transporter [Maledivibacter sp.]